MWTSKPKKLPVEVTEDEFAQLLTVTKQMKHKVAFLLAWGSGMRIGEVIRLQKEDVNLDGKEIRINQGKGSKDRIVPLPRGFKEKHMEFIPFDFKDRSLQKTFRLYSEKSGLKQGYEIKLLNKNNFGDFNKEDFVLCRVQWIGDKENKEKPFYGWGHWTEASANTHFIVINQNKFFCNEDGLFPINKLEEYLRDAIITSMMRIKNENI